MRRFTDQRESNEPVWELRDDFDLVEVVRSGEEFGHLRSGDAQNVLASCLHCPDKPCVELSDDELQADIGLDSTYYPAKAICAFDAIEWSQSDHAPITNDNCVGCGACLGRCPAGAIRRTPSNQIDVNKDRPAPEAFTEVPDWTLSDFKKHTAEFLAKKANRSPSQEEVQQTVNGFKNVLAGIDASTNPKLTESLLARNLLQAIGFEARAGTPGDVNSRPDMVFRHGQKVCLAEIETAPHTLLNSVRRLLTEYASIRNRQDLPSEKLEAMVIWSTFPSERTELYELIENIRDRTELKIRAIPFCLLYLLATYGYHTDEINLTEGFLLSRGKKSVAEEAFERIGLPLPSDTNGFFGPTK